MNTYPKTPGHARRRGFTLIELLVVISIIGTLTAILLPALGTARRAGRAAVSLSNSKQWGVGNLMSIQDDKGYFAWEGGDFASSSGGAIDADNVDEAMKDDAWWGNMVPPYVDKPKYRDMQPNVPGPGDPTSFFVDPSAVAQPGATVPYVGSGWKFFFCYVPNSNLNNGEDDDRKGVHEYKSRYRVRENQITKADATVLFMEIRTTQDELPENDPFRFRNGTQTVGPYYLARSMANWKRFAARHNGGGHLTFADGHAAYFSHDFITTDSNGVRSSAKGSFDSGPTYNKPEIIWNPFTPPAGKFLAFN